MRDHQRPGSVDARLALGVSLVALLLYGATLQNWYYGDAPQLVNRFAQGIDQGRLEFWMHVLYMPAGYWVERVLPGYQPVLALKLLSVLAGAIALGGAFLLARFFGVTRKSGLACVALLGVTPAFWFFATMIEVHALHAASVAVCACVTVYAPWKKPVLAVTLSCVAFPLVFLSHRSGLLLGPAWVLLVQFARDRAVGEVFGWRGLVFGVGGAHFASLLLAMFAGQMLYTGELGLGITLTMDFVDELYRGFNWRVVEFGILYPFAFMIPAVVFGCRGRPRLEMWLYTAAVLPILLFFLFLFGDPTEGGYFLGVAPFLAILCGRGFDRLKWPAVGWIFAVLLVCQAGLGVQRVCFSGYEHLGAQRALRVEQTHKLLPDGGVVVTLGLACQTISGVYEGLREINLIQALEVSRPTHTPEQFALKMRAMTKTFGSPLAFDLGYQLDGEVHKATVEYVDLAFAAVERLGPTRRVTVDGRRFLIVED